MASTTTASFTYFPTEGEPIGVPASDELFDYMRKHGTPISRIGNATPGFIILKLTRSMIDTGPDIPQPLLHLLISLVACYGDGRLLQTSPDDR